MAFFSSMIQRVISLFLMIAVLGNFVPEGWTLPAVEMACQTEAGCCCASLEEIKDSFCDGKTPLLEKPDCACKASSNKQMLLSKIEFELQIYSLNKIESCDYLKVLLHKHIQNPFLFDLEKPPRQTFFS